MERVEKAYLQNWDLLYAQKRVQTPEPIMKKEWGITRGLLKKLFETISPEIIIQAINKGIKDDWIVNKTGYSLRAMLTENMINKLINAAQVEPTVSKHRREKLTIE
jgi:hypothetical protein